MRIDPLFSVIFIIDIEFFCLHIKPKDKQERKSRNISERLRNQCNVLQTN